MKRIIAAAAFCTICLLAASPASAQFSISAGYDRVQYTKGSSRYGGAFDGFSMELSYTYRLHGIGLNMGAGYSFATRNNGNRMFGTYRAKATSQEQSVYIPLRVLKEIRLSSDGTNAFSIFGGAYGSYAIKGNDTYEFTLDGGGKADATYNYLDDSMSHENPLPDGIFAAVSAEHGGKRLTRLDYGLQFGAGFRICDVLYLGAAYNIGLAERFDSRSYGNLRRKYVSLRAAFLF